MSWEGVIVIDKPAGMTSAAVVSRVRAILDVDKAGHTGTLDPLATGVLPVCLGNATKLAGYLLSEDKTYDAELILGAETDTYDTEGKVVGGDPAAALRVSAAQVRDWLDNHIGPQEQVPPRFSAVKVGGRRLHELARSGVEVTAPPRQVTVHALELLAMDPPVARVRIACSKGTYVRSLVHDLGRGLGCGAHLTGLRRVRSGAFVIDQALALAELSPARARACLIAAAAVTGMTSVVASPELLARVADGKLLAPEEFLVQALPERFQLVTVEGELAALLRFEGGAISYDRVFRRS
jgi:tRNA pseudouridine55 synthase